MGNPDRLLLDRFRDQGGKAVAFDSNPFATALGGEIVEVNAELGRLVMDFSPGPEFLQGNGVIQGGAISAMLDFALGLCPMSRLPPDVTTATASLTVSFLSAARPGRLRVAAQIDKLGKRMAFTHATLEDADGRLVATGVSVVSIIADRAAGS